MNARSLVVAELEIATAASDAEVCTSFEQREQCKIRVVQTWNN